MPVITTAAAISTVTAMPSRMAGKYRSISCHLKNASRKRDHASMTLSPGHDLLCTSPRTAGRGRPHEVRSGEGLLH